MQNKIIRIATMAVFACLLLLVTVHCPVLADAKSQIQSGIDTAAGGQGTASPDKTLTDTVTQIINIFSAIVGVVAVIMLIIGGFRYIVSAGNETAISESKKTIIYALVGLIIVAFAQIIVKFVLKNITA